MMLLGALATAILLWWIVKGLSGGDPKRIAKLLRMAGGALGLAVAGLLLLRGRMDMALLVGGGAAWLLGWNHLPLPFGLGGAQAGTRGRVSRVRSASIEMQLAHETGALSGTVLSGRHAGRPLSVLSPSELVGLLAELSGHDPEGVRLVEAYLDRTHPGWRETAEAGAHRQRGPEPKLDAMSEKEAHQILGLQPGADADAVRAAHRNLIKRLHPDGGGSTYLASRVNQAKDVLLNRHR